MDIDVECVPTFFETDQDMERRLRQATLLKADELSLVELMKFHSPAVALSIFVRQLQEVMQIKRLDKHNVNEKMFQVTNNRQKLQIFNTEVQNMKKSASYEFKKMPRKY